MTEKSGNNGQERKKEKKRNSPRLIAFISFTFAASAINRDLFPQLNLY